MENARVARILGEIADITELVEGNPFKVRAYRRAAQVVELLPGPVSELWRNRKLTDLPGIGERIAAHIGELVETGACEEHDRLTALVPRDILELLRLEGVGPKTVALLWHSLGVTSVDALERACIDGSVLKLPRMGKVRAQSMLKAIERHRARRGRMPLHHVLPYAQSMVARLREVPGVVRAEVAGSVRRRSETVGDIDLLVVSRDPAATMRAFGELSEIERVTAEGPTKASGRLAIGLDVDLRVLPEESFGAALHYFTGSKSHNIAIRTRAVRMGLKLSEYGVFDRKGKRIGGRDEEDVFRAVKLPFIPPELREDTGEIEAAERGELPRLLEQRDLRGDLHVHTKASSDGKSSLEEIASQARSLGYAYVAITDHSRSRPLGLDEAGLLEHVAKIRALDQKLRGRPHLLTGIEVDILADGSLDLPLALLASLDCVVASVHSHFRQPREVMTERIVRALSTGVVHVLGHPSGRQIGARDPYDYDLERVLRAASDYDVAMEINAMPDRLDLNDKACRLAKERGVRLVVNSDAHHAGHLHNIRYGVWVARRGWLEKGDVLNALPYEELRKRLRRRVRPYREEELPPMSP